VTNKELHELIIHTSHELADATLLRRTWANWEKVIDLHCVLACMLEDLPHPKKPRNALGQTEVMH